MRDHPRAYVGQEENCRRFVEATLWMLKSGAQWRLLPEENGKWNSDYKCFTKTQRTPGLEFRDWRSLRLGVGFIDPVFTDNLWDARDPNRAADG